MRLVEGLAQGGGFLAVAASEIGELGGQRAYHAGGKVLAGEGGGNGLWPGRLHGAMVLDAGADGGVAVEEIQGDPDAGGQAAEGDRLAGLDHRGERGLGPRGGGRGARGSGFLQVGGVTGHGGLPGGRSRRRCGPGHRRRG